MMSTSGPQYPEWLPSAQKSADFSDLTIKCGSKEFKVHRLVICAQSTFFKAACVNDFREAQTATIKLPEDEPDIIERLIEFCYRADYTAPSSDTNLFLKHSKIFAAATKYDIPKLAETAVQKFHKAAVDNWNANGFLIAIPHIYNSTTDDVKALRKTAMHAARTHLRNLTETRTLYDAWKNTCLDVPEFAFDALNSTGIPLLTIACVHCQKLPVVNLYSNLIMCPCNRTRLGCLTEWVAVDPK